MGGIEEMMTKQEQAVLDAVLTLMARHENTIGNALDVYIRDMTKTANETQSEYESVKDDPEAAARQDASLITVNGLKHAAQMFREAADHAQLALDELEELAEKVDEL
jgi:hypothetical protein